MSDLDAALSAAPMPLQRRIAALAILASLGAVAVAQRDLTRRPSAEVRGSKLAWRIGSTNAVVALTYLRWGRR